MPSPFKSPVARVRLMSTPELPSLWLAAAPWNSTVSGLLVSSTMTGSACRLDAARPAQRARPAGSEIRSSCSRRFMGFVRVDVLQTGWNSIGGGSRLLFAPGLPGGRKQRRVQVRRPVVRVRAVGQFADGCLHVEARR